MKVRLPKREHVHQTSAADPLKFYYLPIARSFYLARFADAVRLLGDDIGRLLEVGCGSGIFLTELARHCRHLVACDAHPRLDLVGGMLRREAVRADLARIDARRLPFADSTFDAIVCMSVLEHLRDLEAPAREFERVLRPGGVAVIGVPVENALTTAILRVSYLSLDAELDDEHVSTHRDVLRVLGQRFELEKGLSIPRGSPEAFRLYRTVRFRKPARG